MPTKSRKAEYAPTDHRDQNHYLDTKTIACVAGVLKGDRREGKRDRGLGIKGRRLSVSLLALFFSSPPLPSPPLPSPPLPSLPLPSSFCNCHAGYWNYNICFDLIKHILYGTHRDLSWLLYYLNQKPLSNFLSLLYENTWYKIPFWR